MRISNKLKKPTWGALLGILVWLILMIGAQSVCAQHKFTLKPISIESPRAGDTWAQGSNKTITWFSWTIASTAKLRLQLMQGTSLIGKIAENISVTPSSYPWVVGTYQGGKANPGSNYIIRIQQMDDSSVYSDSETFTISVPVVAHTPSSKTYEQIQKILPTTDQPSSSKTWATDQPSHSMALKKGDVMITEFKMAPLKDKGNHLQIIIKFSNQLSEKVKNLRLILVKNHLQVKEWKPLGLGPKGKGQVRYDDDLPQPFKTNNYRAILTTDLSSSLPPAETVLDRKEASYR